MSLWDISTKEVYNFVDFANAFHPTNIKFTCEISSKCTVFLDTEVFKGPRISTHKILNLQTHFKPTETFQYTHLPSCHPSNCKKVRGEALHVQLLHLPPKILSFVSAILNPIPKQLISKDISSYRSQSEHTKIAIH